MAVLEIRPETSGDIPYIHQVHTKAFYPSPNEARLVDLLRQDDQAALSLVALIDRQVVGHVLFSSITLVPRQEGLHGLGLAPLGVLPAFQNQGIGGALTREGLRACEQAGCDLVVVLGDPRYYSCFGFSPAQDYGLDNEYGAAEEFMLMELRAAALGAVRGLVKYRPEFKETGC